MGYRHRTLKTLALAGLLGVAAGLAGCGPEAPANGPDPNPVDPDPAPGDTVPGRKALEKLAKSMARLPLPVGTRYFYAPAAKASASLACKGEMDVFAIPANPRGMMGVDTVTYFDAHGAPHCAQSDSTLREEHSRYLFDPASGEAWERIRIDITPDDLLPRHRGRGTGRIRLISGLEAEIDSFDVDMALDNSTGSPVFRNAHLSLSTPDGHVLRLDLVRPHPFRAPDFYPVWDDSPPGFPVMGGPVLRGKDTVGRASLYADRTLGYTDAAGKPVTLE